MSKEFKISNMISVCDYYQSPGARELSHSVKRGGFDACEKIATYMAENTIISEGSTLIPLPSSEGNATSNLIICKLLSQKININVSDCITGNMREPLYYMKLNGQHIDDDFLEMWLTKPEPVGLCYLFDVVVDTGLTMKSAKRLFLNSDPVCLSFALVNKHTLEQPHSSINVNNPIKIDTKQKLEASFTRSNGR